jgi:hypothetical protein
MTTFAKPENALKRAEGDLKLLPLLLTVDIIFFGSQNGCYLVVQVLHVSDWNLD